MIQLTRLNSQKLAVNPDLIKFVEQSPDTVVTLLTGEKILVRETAVQIIELVTDFRRTLLAGMSFGASDPTWIRRTKRPAQRGPSNEADRGQE